MVLKAMKSVAEFSYLFHFWDREEMEKTLCFPSVPRHRFGLLRKNPTENFIQSGTKFSVSNIATIFDFPRDSGIFFRNFIK